MLTFSVDLMDSDVATALVTSPTVIGLLWGVFLLKADPGKTKKNVESSQRSENSQPTDSIPNPYLNHEYNVSWSKNEI